MSALTRYPVPQSVPAGAVDDPRLYFRLPPTIVPDPVLDFMRPMRGLPSIKAGAVDDPWLYFRLEAAVPAGRIMSSLVGSGGLVGQGGLAGQGGGLAG